MRLRDVPPGRPENVTHKQNIHLATLADMLGTDPMKIAYLILAHAAPRQVLRVVDRLRAPGTVFVVHVDARSDDAVFVALQGHADVHLAPRARCYWGGYGIVQGALNCIQTLRALQLPFDYAVLLSGQDYPIKTPEQIEAFLHCHPGAEFMDCFAMDEPNRWTRQGGAFQAMNRVLRYTISFRSRLLQMPFRRRFYAGWKPYGGFTWWVLSRPAIEWMADYVEKHPALTRYYRHAFIADESMFQTLISNSPFAANISPSVHYYDWQRPNPKYPRTLDDEDFDRLAAAPELFARKLNEVQSASLMARIDRELLGLRTE